MKRLLFPLFVLCCFSLWGCGSSRPTHADAPVGTGDAVCDDGLRIFNANSVNRLASSLRTIQQRHGSIPADLTAAYPAARDAWNSALRRVTSGYTSGWTSGLPHYTGDWARWREQNLPDAQKFFFLLTEYEWGAYPQGTHDLLSVAGWQEHADIRDRFESMVRVGITRNCPTRSADAIRGMLNPKPLPANLEDCLAP